MDAVAIIAVSAKLDLPFVMALQTARVLMVIFFGPALARFLSRASAPARNPAID
ncbi:AbrB family transcriptional regulator [Rhodoblastus sp.]|uniref:AbrB family transcriptional regulator n=1 Tax=Rhodoblastus sp. TaxID=1962975 RepID=UPI003F9E9E19